MVSPIGLQVNSLSMGVPFNTSGSVIERKP